MSGYISNVPLSNQTLSQTQPTINNNFTVLNANMGADHVDFTNSPPPGGNGGLHNKVSLVQQGGDPSSATSIDILYTKSAAGKTEVFMRRASGDGGNVIQLTTAAGNPVASANGVSFLPGGMIIQWGLQSAPSDNVQINFPTTFPNNCFTVTATPYKSGSISSLTGFGVKSPPSTTGFTTRFSGTTLDYIGWMAIGN